MLGSSARFGKWAPLGSEVPGAGLEPTPSFEEGGLRPPVTVSLVPCRPSTCAVVCGSSPCSLSGVLTYRRVRPSHVNLLCTSTMRIVLPPVLPWVHGCPSEALDFAPTRPRRGNRQCRCSGRHDRQRLVGGHSCSPSPSRCRPTRNRPMGTEERDSHRS
jgi:hypothetical protein